MVVGEPVTSNMMNPNPTTWFSQIRTDAYLPEIPLDVQIPQSRNVPLTYTTASSLAVNYDILSASMAIDLENGDQSQVTPMGKKRRIQYSKSGGEMKQKCRQRKNLKAEKKTDKKEVPVSGYIHVRARRGEATDSHSLAERVRRGKISEKMKLLQSLVPGCNKITGKLQILEEIINYVQSLQIQVEILVSKLASVNPSFTDFDVNLGTNLHASENFGILEPPLPTMLPSSSTQLPETVPTSVPFLSQQEHISHGTSFEDDGIPLWEGDVNLCGSNGVCPF